MFCIDLEVCEWCKVFIVVQSSSVCVCASYSLWFYLVSFQYSFYGVFADFYAVFLIDILAKQSVSIVCSFCFF